MARGSRSAWLLVAVTVLSSALPSLGFQPLGSWGLVPRGGAFSQHAARSTGASVRCVRPGLRMLDEAAVVKNMEAVEAGTPGKVSKKVFKAIKKPSSALIAIQELSRSKAPEEKIRSMLHQNWSWNQRRDKKAAIIVDTTVPEAMDDLELFVKEQQVLNQRAAHARTQGADQPLLARTLNLSPPRAESQGVVPGRDPRVALRAHVGQGGRGDQGGGGRRGCRLLC